MQTKLEQEDSVQEFQGFNKPLEKPWTQEWKEFLYNQEQGTVMGRNGKSWGEYLVPLWATRPGLSLPSPRPPVLPRP